LLQKHCYVDPSSSIQSEIRVTMLWCI